MYLSFLLLVAQALWLFNKVADGLIQLSTTAYLHDFFPFHPNTLGEEEQKGVCPLPTPKQSAGEAVLSSYLPHPLSPTPSHPFPFKVKAGSCPGFWTLRPTYICTFLKLKTSCLMVFECNRTMSDLQDVCANVAQMYNNIFFYIVYLKEIKLMSQCGTLESFKAKDVHGKMHTVMVKDGGE